MNLDELRRIRDAILEHPGMEQLAQNVAHVISYLMSEQEKRRALNSAMDNLRTDLATSQKAMTELGFDIRGMKERSERNGKLLMTVTGSLLSIIVLELLRLALK